MSPSEPNGYVVAGQIIGNLFMLALVVSFFLVLAFLIANVIGGLAWSTRELLAAALTGMLVKAHKPNQ